jgi:hypothetical protein
MWTMKIGGNDHVKIVEVMRKSFGFLFAAGIAAASIAAGALTGCEDVNPGGGRHVTYPVYSHVTRLKGVVEDDFGVLDRETGPFTVKFKVFGDDSGFVEVASCSLSADGAFSMELPESLEANLLRVPPFEEEAGITVSDGNVKTSAMFGGAWLDIYDGEGRFIGDISYSSPSEGRGVIVFADGDCTISGSVTFNDDGRPITDTYGLNLKRGWNWLFAYDGYGADMHLRTKIPSDARYYLGIRVE